MFQFAPPNKVARTQRSSNLHTTTVAGDRSQGSFAANTQDIPRPLSGVGKSISWRTDLAANRVQLWSHHDTWPHNIPSTASLPKLSANEGALSFSAELAAHETVVYCTDRGEVMSLDKALEFNFVDNRGAGPIQVTCFDAFSGMGSDVVISCVGTEDGTILIAQQEMEDSLARSMAVCALSQRVVQKSTARASRRWLPGWLGGGGASALDASAVTVADMVLSSVSEVHVIPGTVTEHNPAVELWAVTGQRVLSRFRVADRKQQDATVVWSVDLPQALDRTGTILCTSWVESMQSIAVLFAADPLESRGAHALIVVLLSWIDGQVRSSTPLSGIAAGRLHGQAVPSLAALISVNGSGSSLDVIYHHYVVRINTAVGVRQPCTSEDVSLVAAAEEHGLLASGKTADGRVLFLSYSGGPCVSDDVVVPRGADRSKADPSPNVRANSPLFGEASLNGVQQPNPSHMAQRLAAVISASRLDSRMTLDECILNAHDEILGNVPLHTGNWARANLDAEDVNIFNAVTKSLTQREGEHFAFVRHVLTHPELGLNLQPQTLATILSGFEQLHAMVSIRKLQNQIGSFDASQFSAFESKGIVATMQRFESPPVIECAQKALKQAIVTVANQLRATAAPQGAALATAAELTFSRPSNILLLLAALLDQLKVVLKSVLPNSVKVQECLALITIIETVQSSTNVARDGYLIAPAHSTSFNDSATSALREGAPLYPEVAPLMWTALIDQGESARGTTTKLSTIVAESLRTVTNTLASIQGPKVDATELTPQTMVMQIVAKVIQTLFSHTQTTATDLFRSTLLQRTFLVFAAEPLGYPYGAPVAAVATTVAEQALSSALKLAQEFDCVRVLYQFFASQYHESPLSVVAEYAQLRAASERSVLLLRFCMQSMLDERREEELLVLPQLLGDWCRVERDSFLRTKAPHLMWQANSKAFFALCDEGAVSSIDSAVVPYGPEALVHRSRCVSMAKLAWVAAGEPTVKSYFDLNVHSAVVTAQSKHLSSSHSNVFLSPEAAVAQLLETSSVEAAVDAVKIADAVEPALRKALFVAILRRALQADDPKYLLSLRQNVVSETEFVSELAKPNCWSGRILATSPILRDSTELRNAVKEACGSALRESEQEDLVNTFVSWVRLQQQNPT